jgi:hypothetical protein
MTTAEFRAWLDERFPGHHDKGRPSGMRTGAIDAAAAYLGITRSSVIRKRNGTQPITARDERMIQLKQQKEADNDS